MYKKSIYNICIGNVSDNKLYYNSFTGSISLFDNKSLNFWKAYHYMMIIQTKKINN